MRWMSMKRMRRVLLWVVAALAIQLALGWGALALWKRSLDERLATQVDELRREGAPTDIAPLARTEVPAEQDALRFLKEGKKLADQEEEHYFGEFDQLSEEEWKEVEAWVDGAEALTPFTRAADMPRCSWIYEDREPPCGWLPEPLSPVQTGVQLFEAEARVMLRRGATTADVLAVADRMLALGRHVDDRFAIGWLVRRTVETMTVKVVREAAVAPGADLDALDAWVRERAREDGVRPVGEVLACERACAQAMLEPRYGGLAAQVDRMREAYENLRGSFEGLRERELVPKGAPDLEELFRPRVSCFVSLLLHSPAGGALDRRVALAWLDVDARAIAACRTLDAGTPAALHEALAGTTRLWFDPFGPQVPPLSLKLVGAMLRRRALFTVTEAGVAAIAWRREHGDWPPTLDTTVGPDPFTDAPLIYERTHRAGWEAPDGVRILSRAPEATDDIPWTLPDEADNGRERLLISVLGAPDERAPEGDRRFMEALAQLAGKNGWDPAECEWCDGIDGGRVRIEGGRTMYAGDDDRFVAVLEPPAGTSVNKLLLLDRWGRLLDTVACAIDSRDGGLRTERLRGLQDDAAEVAIRLVPASGRTGNGGQTITFRGRAYTFREQPSPDLCRVAIDEKGFRVVFPDLAQAGR